MKFLFIALVLSLISFNSFAYSAHPCLCHGGGSQVNPNDPDQLLEVGTFLMKHLRPVEAVECLNRAKRISPHYLDVRLALMNSFHDIGDKISGMEEAEAFTEFGRVNEYYQETYETYLEKLNRLTTSRSVEGHTYIRVDI